MCVLEKSKFLIFRQKLGGPLTRGGGEGVSPLAAEIR